MQVAVSIRLYEYEHEQAKLKKKRRNNNFFLLKINMQKETIRAVVPQLGTDVTS
jgi:hypothetical protein